jgi:hypothetical protein
MEMMNRAIEDVADYNEMMQKIMRREEQHRHRVQGETRGERRLRERVEKKAAARAQKAGAK